MTPKSESDLRMWTESIRIAQERAGVICELYGDLLQIPPAVQQQLIQLGRSIKVYRAEIGKILQKENNQTLIGEER